MKPWPLLLNRTSRRRPKRPRPTASATRAAHPGGPGKRRGPAPPGPARSPTSGGRRSTAAPTSTGRRFFNQARIARRVTGRTPLLACAGRAQRPRRFGHAMPAPPLCPPKAASRCAGRRTLRRGRACGKPRRRSPAPRIQPVRGKQNLGRRWNSALPAGRCDGGSGPPRSRRFPHGHENTHTDSPAGRDGAALRPG
jgi:hypothetical protein